ncbi:MAG TPA: hypothetical protein VN688_21135 [Gemmataceae bacterium]|nr:hypothetical protein [Gemmataceae bacterium]
MKRDRFGVVLLILVGLTAHVSAADPPPLLTGQGAIEKVGKDVLTVKQRGPDGKFGKSLVLKITGTSKVTTLVPRMQKGSLIVTQKDTDVKDLLPKQTIAILYTMVKGSPVLLSAVVQPTDAK